MAAGCYTDIALAVVGRGGLWLVSRRRTDDAFDGLWEFPGGKILPGESAPEAAVRECAEELSVVVEPIHALPSVQYEYDEHAVRLRAVLCRLVGGEPVPSEPAVAEARWVDDRELTSLKMPSANAKLVAILLARDS